MPGDMPVGIVREGTKPTQETLVATLDTIVAEVERTRFAAPAIVVIGTVVNEREEIRWFDNGPLFGKRVLVTRPRGQADEFAAALCEAGAEPVLAPTIAIGAPDDAAAAGEAVKDLGTYTWVVFTSRNGVDACFDLLAKSGSDARRFGEAKVAAIGAKTAQRLRAFGITADFVPATFVAESVTAGLLDRTLAGDRILLFGAQETRDVIAGPLRDGGRITDIVAAYKTTHVTDGVADLAETCDVWTFASASSVHAFLELVPGAVDLAQDKLVACIGPVTAEAAREAGLEPDVVAETATVEGLLDAMERAVAVA
jgi:uroporphyrinogen III methyltransferase/synthase